jgi:hypothetical protein
VKGVHRLPIGCKSKRADERGVRTRDLYLHASEVDVGVQWVWNEGAFGRLPVARYLVTRIARAGGLDRKTVLALASLKRHCSYELNLTRPCRV